MEISVREFEKEYIVAIQTGTAAIFAGAGIGRESGFVNWKELLSDIAQNIGLDVNKESDLVAVAQYHVNERGSRSGINSLILNGFVKDAKPNPLVTILTKLPVNTYWTTNYDRLLENSFSQQGRMCDVKISPASVSITSQWADTVLYKMHGDYKQADQCVLTKDDYEIYDRTRRVFTTTLQAHLITKTFLFVGFSFDDPNLNYILSRIRLLLGENVRPHYCFFERIKKNKGNREKASEFNYRSTKQALRIEDLKRYGIHAVLVDSYGDIPKILERIYLQKKKKNVFISGSAHEYGPNWQNTGIQFVRELTNMLYSNDCRIVTGHGRGVGSYIIGTVLERTQSNVKLLESHLHIKAFPYQEKGTADYDSKKAAYRRGIAESVGISIFIFGNHEDTDKGANFSTLSCGMLEEFIAAKQAKNYIIPVGSTGYMARQIYDEVCSNKSDYPYLKANDLKVLGTCTDCQKLVKKIEQILERIRNQ